MSKTEMITKRKKESKVAVQLGRPVSQWILGCTRAGRGVHTQARAPQTPLSQLRISSQRITRAAIKPSSHLDYPDRTPFLKMTTQQLMAGPIFRLRTGHTRCLNHLMRLNIVQDDTCRCCHRSSETAAHLMLRCPALLPVF